jgi:hypothetical protein
MVWRQSAARIYRALLFAYPAEFRHEYGTEMQQLFADRLGWQLSRNWGARLTPVTTGPDTNMWWRSATDCGAGSSEERRMRLEKRCC